MSDLLLFNEQPFLPTVYGGDIQLWLDASDLSTIDVDTTFTWSDKSGNGNNATATTTQPTSGASTQNGKNLLDFDGTESLVLPSALYTIPTGDNTIITVSKRTTEDGTFDCLIGMGQAGVNNGNFLLYNNTAGEVVYRNSQAANTVISTGNDNDAFQILTGRRSGTTQGVAVNNGTEVTATTATDPTTVNIARIGLSAAAGINFIGSLAEILIYDRSLSTAELLMVNNYLANKWAITL